jgi:uncharacterized protein (DUF2164 family)
MIVRFEYERELPTQRLGDGLVDWVKPQYEIISGELNVEMFLNQISNEVGIKNIKLFNINENK